MLADRRLPPCQPSTSYAPARQVRNIRHYCSRPSQLQHHHPHPLPHTLNHARFAWSNIGGHGWVDHQVKASSSSEVRASTYENGSHSRDGTHSQTISSASPADMLPRLNGLALPKHIAVSAITNFPTSLPCESCHLSDWHLTASNLVWYAWLHHHQPQSCMTNRRHCHFSGSPASRSDI